MPATGGGRSREPRLPTPEFLAAGYVAASSLVAFTAMAIDKHRAKTGQWRIPERTLLTLAAVGGSIGVMTAQRLLRHKTWKEPFRTHLRIIIGLQAALLGLVAFLAIRHAFSVLLPG